MATQTLPQLCSALLSAIYAAEDAQELGDTAEHGKQRAIRAELQRTIAANYDWDQALEILATPMPINEPPR